MAQNEESDTDGNASKGTGTETDASGDTETEASRDISHLIRWEGLVSDSDLRVEVAENFSRYVAGDEDVILEESILGVNGPMAVSRGSRTRTVGEYERVTDGDEVLNVSSSVEEIVEGGVHLEAALGAEALIGGG